MVTLNELINDIRNFKYGGIQPDTRRLGDRQIKLWIKEERSYFLDQLIRQIKNVPEEFIQTIKCIPIECYNLLEECNCIDMKGDVGVRVLRTPILPMPISNDLLGESRMFLEVSTLAGDSITIINKSEAKLYKYKKYSGNKPYGWYEDRRLYFENLEEEDLINIRLLADDPEELKNFASCDGTVCYSDDEAYPITTKLSKLIKMSILERYIIPGLQLPKDNSNNAKDDPQ